MTTPAAVIQQMIRNGGIGRYIANANITSLAAGNFVSVLFFRDSSLNTNSMRALNAGYWRPGAATLADYWRNAGDLTTSSGTAAVDVNWADTTLGSEDIYRLDYGIHPQHVIDSLQLGLGKIYFQNFEPLSLAADAGFQSTATTAYTESDADSGPATTFSKVTTAGAGLFSTSVAAGRVLNAAANGYIRQRFDVEPGSTVYIGALGRPTTFTANLVITNASTGAVLYSTAEYTGNTWGYFHAQVGIPTGCTSLEVRLQGVEALADVRWNGLWVYRQNDLRIDLNSTWEATAFHIPALSYATFNRSINGDVDSAYSIDLQEIPPDKYDFVFERVGASPSAIQFHTDEYFHYPIYIHGRRAQSDVSTVTLADITTDVRADLDLWDAQARVVLFSMDDILSRVPNADRKLAKALYDRNQIPSQYVIEGPEKRQKFGDFGFVGN